MLPDADLLALLLPWPSRARLAKVVHWLISSKLPPTAPGLAGGYMLLTGKTHNVPSQCNLPPAHCNETAGAGPPLCCKGRPDLLRVS